MTDMERKKTIEKLQTPTRELDLIHQVGEWAEKNFGTKRWPELGVVEEIGEATHALLKHHQGIRKFKNRDEFLSKFIDALGDTVIFLCDWCSLHNAFFQFGRCQKTEPKFVQENIILLHLLQATSQLFSDYSAEQKEITDPGSSFIAQRIVQGLTYWACKYELDLPLIVSGVWANVSKRDWKLNPETAGDE